MKCYLKAEKLVEASTDIVINYLSVDVSLNVDKLSEIRMLDFGAFCVRYVLVDGVINVVKLFIFDFLHKENIFISIICTVYSIISSINTWPHLESN